METKSVLITGGAGFIGANFVYKFLGLGYKVFVFEREEADLWRIEKAKAGINLYSPDLTDRDETEKVISQINPEIVIHFAAYGAFQRTQQDIGASIDVNLKGTINLIDACNKIGVQCFISTGSSSEYGTKNSPIKETDVLEADNIYGITKGAAAMYCQMMARKFDFPVAIMRPFAVYGYFEEKERLIPTIINSCLACEELELTCSDSVRDFIFIEDLMDAYLSAIENIGNIKGQIFNIGTGKQSTIGQVAVLVKEITRSGIEPRYGQVKPAQTEPKTWVADVSKAKKMLDWRAKHSLEEGLEKDVKWFRENINLYK